MPRKKGSGKRSETQKSYVDKFTRGHRAARNSRALEGFYDEKAKKIDKGRSLSPEEIQEYIRQKELGSDHPKPDVPSTVDHE